MVSLDQQEEKKQGHQWDLLGYDLCAVQEHHVTVDSKDDTNDSNYIFNHPQLKVDNYDSVPCPRIGDNKRGGIAWYFKKGMNVEHWERKNGNETQKYSDKRKLWVKIRTEEGEIMMCNVYMPCEGGPICKQKQYGDILADIKEDINKIKSEGNQFFIFGDFNAHIGNDEERGIICNNEHVGPNGIALTNWVEDEGLIIINALTNV